MSGHQPTPSCSAAPAPLPAYPLLLLKGAPLATLIALRRYGAGNRRHLSMLTGWKKAALDDALRLLQEMGLVARPAFSRWAITPAGTKLLQELLADPQPPPEETTPAEPDHDSSAATKKLDTPKSGSSPQRGKSKGPKNRSSQTMPAAKGPKNRSSRATPAPEGPKNGSSVGEEAENRLSPHDHDHDDHYIHDHEQHEHDHDPETPDPRALARRLATLRPPFDRAAHWLATMPHDLVAAWLNYLDALPPRERRSRFRNEAGLLRRQVEAGAWPPSGTGAATPRGHPATAVCPDCGQSHYLRDGVCWLCHGIARR